MKQRLQAILTSLQSENARVIRSSLIWQGYRRQSGVFGALWILATAVLVGLIIDLVQYPRDALTLSEFFFFAYYLVYTVYFFAVILDHPELGRRSRQTRAIFQTHAIIPPLMEDYVNQTVTVAYNPATETLVVIG